MNLQQTSCLLLLKVIHRLGKLNGGAVVAVLILALYELADIVGFNEWLFSTFCQ
jgi:hypothetical protein